MGSIECLKRCKPCQRLLLMIRGQEVDVLLDEVKSISRYTRYTKPSLSFDVFLLFSFVGYYNLLIICAASTTLFNLAFGRGQSNPRGTSFIASPVPNPRPILPGYSISSAAKACAIIAG